MKVTTKEIAQKGTGHEWYNFSETDREIIAVPLDRTNLGQREECFRTTRWSLISEIRDPDSRQSKQILNNLFQDYWKPVYCYLRSKGIENENAKDLTQGFFCNILFEKNLFARAHKAKGKFRTLLLTALQNYIISENRRQTAQKRTCEKGIIGLDQIHPAALVEPLQSHQDDDSFNYAWITSLLDNAAEQVKASYCSKGKKTHWTAFSKRFLEPTIQNTQAPSLSSICEECSIEDEIKASNMVTSVKRSFQKALRSHIREYVYADSDVDEELSELLHFLHKYVQD